MPVELPGELAAVIDRMAGCRAGTIRGDVVRAGHAHLSLRLRPSAAISGNE